VPDRKKPRRLLAYKQQVPGIEATRHHCDDPSQTETTILIGLAEKNA
jgi:hypothetical protein